MTDQRVRSGKIDVIGDRDQSRRSPFRLEPAGGVGEQQRLAAKAMKRVDRDPHRARIAALIIMAAALKQRDLPALDRSHDQAPGMAFDARDREAGNVEIRDRGRVARFIGKSAQARAEHDRERRQRIEPAVPERVDCRVRGRIHSSRLVEYEGRAGGSTGPDLATS